MSHKKFNLVHERVINILERNKLPIPIKEYRFHPTRLWRFDFCYPDKKIAIEFEGGIYTGGAHTRGAHFSSDCDKYNQAQILGYRVLRYTLTNIYSLPVDLIALGV